MPNKNQQTTITQKLHFLIHNINRRKQKGTPNKSARKISTENSPKPDQSKDDTADPETSANCLIRTPSDGTGGYGNRRSTLSDVKPDQIWKPSPVKRTLPRTPVSWYGVLSK